MSRLTLELTAVLAVALGGAIGSMARYGVSRIAVILSVESVERFPWPTFLVNVVGSFLLGLIAAIFRNHPQPLWWILLGTGFCGGFTTFSTFSLETLTLLEQKRYFMAGVYSLGAVAVGLVAAGLAMRLSRGE